MNGIDYLLRLVEETVPLDPEVIKQKYNEFNSKYFDSVLPGDLPMLIKSFKGSYAKTLARVKRSINGGIDYITPQSITFSDYYRYDNDLLDGILLHEMIHIKQYLEKDPSLFRRGEFLGSHGYTFEKEYKRLKSLGLPVVNSEEVVNKEVEYSDKLKKQVGILTVEKEDGKISIAPFNKKLITNPGDQTVIDYVSKSYVFGRNKSTKLTLATTDSAFINLLPIRTKLKGLSFYRLTPEQLEDIKKDWVIKEEKTI